MSTKSDGYDKSQELETVKNLLNNANEQWSKQPKEKEDHFNVFRLCGIDHYENSHSRILAELLNPKGSHELGNIFLQEFLKILNNHSQSEDEYASFKNIDEVRREYSTEDGRFDILLTDNNNNNTIIIENKINAPEGEQQLERYASWNKKGGKTLLLFLTLDGREAQSTDDHSSYLPISYKGTILEWLKQCEESCQEKPFLHTAIQQYQNLIKELTGKTKEKYLMPNVIDVIKESKENLWGAYLIENNFSQAYTDFFKETIVKPSLKELKEKNVSMSGSTSERFHAVDLKELKEENVSMENFYRTKYSQIQIELEGKNYHIEFEFQKDNFEALYAGLRLNNEAKLNENTSININYGDKTISMEVDKNFEKYKDWNPESKEEVLDKNSLNLDKKNLKLYHPTKAGFLVYFKVCEEDNTVEWTPEAILNTDLSKSKHKTILGKYAAWLLEISKEITINYRNSLKQ